MRRSGYFVGLAGGPRAAAAGALGPPHRPGIDRGPNPSEHRPRAGSPRRPSFLSTIGPASADAPTLASHPPATDSRASTATAGASTVAFHPPATDLPASNLARAEASRPPIVAGLPSTPAPPGNPGDRVRPETIHPSRPQPIALGPPAPPAPRRAAPNAATPAQAAFPGPAAAETGSAGVTDGELLPAASVGPPPGSPPRDSGAGPTAGPSPVDATAERPAARFAMPRAPAPALVTSGASVAVPATSATSLSTSGQAPNLATPPAAGTPASPTIAAAVDPAASARTATHGTLHPQPVPPTPSVQPIAPAPPRAPEAQTIDPQVIRPHRAGRDGGVGSGLSLPAPGSPRAEPLPRETAQRRAGPRTAANAPAQVRIGTIDVTVIPPSPAPPPATPAPVAGAGFTGDAARASLSLPVASWYGMAQR